MGKQPITITIAPELLRKVDAAAAEKGMSRAAYIAMALSYAVDPGIFK
jgi:metal-responsive CopG/Arc/MetJ family transcriptional regulator